MKSVSAIIAVVFVVCAFAACDSLATAPFNDADRFDAPSDGLTQAEMALFAQGDAEFARRFSAADGLGPLFNNVSCASCHSGDGRGVLSNILQRIGAPDDGFLDGLGPQIQDRAIPGIDPEVLPSGIPVSLRLPPPVFGLGLVEAIPESTILARADSADADGDGISGRPNWVVPPDWVPADQPGSGAAPRVGRLGRKAQTTSILQMVAGAYRDDIGITSDFLPSENRNPTSSMPAESVDRVPDPEISVATVRAVTHYIRSLAPPAPGPASQQGQEVFAEVGCSACHVPTMRTGPSPIAALSNRDVPLFSDLLLHDMGDGLADNRPDGSANGREWRTAPLWGMRLVPHFLDGNLFLLHDGRAHTVADAILLHGGEAQRSRDAFAALSPDRRRALLDYVSSR